MVEAPRDLAGHFQVRDLVLSDRDHPGAVGQHIGALQHRIAEEAIGRQVLLPQLLLLVLVRRHAFQPAQRRDHRQQQMQLGMLRHSRLDEQRGGPRTDTSRQPVDNHLGHVLLQVTRILIMRSQRVPVGHEEVALVVVLQLDPVLQHAMIMPEM